MFPVQSHKAVREPERDVHAVIGHKGTFYYFLEKSWPQKSYSLWYTDGHHQYFWSSFWEHRRLRFSSLLSLGMAVGFTNAKWADMVFPIWVKASSHQSSVTGPAPLASVSWKPTSISRCLAKPLKEDRIPEESHRPAPNGERQSMWRPSSFLYPCCLPGCLSKSVPPDWTILSIFT